MGVLTPQQGGFIEEGESRWQQRPEATKTAKAGPSRRRSVDFTLLRREWNSAQHHALGHSGTAHVLPGYSSMAGAAVIAAVSGSQGFAALPAMEPHAASMLEEGPATDWLNGTIDGVNEMDWVGSGPELESGSHAEIEGLWPFVNWTWRNDDLFKDPAATGDSLFDSAPVAEWIFLFGALSFLLVVDGILLRRLEGASGHVVMVFFWFSIAMIYCSHYCLEFGVKAGADWFLGYLLEIILSLDNVFVFHLVFESFRPPIESQHKAMFFGVVGALVARLVLFLALGTVVHTVRWVRLAMGLLLIYSGIKVTVEEDEDDDPANNSVVRGLRYCLGSRLLSHYDSEGRMFVWGEDGRLNATLLLPLIICVEVVDVVFAMDSLSAKVAQIHNQFAAYSSSAFAILALRALFFCLRDMVDYFQHVKYGLCIILVFIGLELLLADFVELPSSALCLAISAVFLISILSSIRAKWNEDRASSRRGSMDSRRSSRRWSQAEMLAAADFHEDRSRRSSREIHVQTSRQVTDDMERDHDSHDEGAAVPPPSRSSSSKPAEPPAGAQDQSTSSGSGNPAPNESTSKS